MTRKERESSLVPSACCWGLDCWGWRWGSAWKLGWRAGCWSPSRWLREATEQSRGEDGGIRQEEEKRRRGKQKCGLESVQERGMKLCPWPWRKVIPELQPHLAPVKKDTAGPSLGCWQALCLLDYILFTHSASCIVARIPSVWNIVFISKSAAMWCICAC